MRSSVIWLRSGDTALFPAYAAVIRRFVQPYPLMVAVGGAVCLGCAGCGDRTRVWEFLQGAGARRGSDDLASLAASGFAGLANAGHVGLQCCHKQCCNFRRHG